MATPRKFTSKVAANGQVVVPKELRDLLSLKGGDSIVFLAEETGTGMIRIEIKKPTQSFKNMVGILSDLKGRSTETILRELDDEDMS
jgi:AbrB family looped-hinge helix DNA binding protein